MKTAKCDITQNELPLNRLTKGHGIRPKIMDLIKQNNPNFDENSYISTDELSKYRKKYLEAILTDEMGELSHLEQDVLTSINENELLSANIEPEINKQLSFGDRLSDNIASFGGSWTFII